MLLYTKENNKEIQINQSKQIVSASWSYLIKYIFEGEYHVI